MYCHQHTSDHFVIEDAIFGRMDDIGDMFKKEVHEEFITNYLLKNDHNFFAEYSYMYVLVAHGPSNQNVSPGEKRWSDILTPAQYDLLRKNGGYVVAWMLMTPEHPVDIHFIEYVDTRVPNHQLTRCMIRKFENEVAVLENPTTSYDKYHQIKPKCVFSHLVQFILNLHGSI